MILGDATNAHSREGFPQQPPTLCEPPPGHVFQCVELGAQVFVMNFPVRFTCTATKIIVGKPMLTSDVFATLFSLF